MNTTTDFSSEESIPSIEHPKTMEDVAKALIANKRKLISVIVRLEKNQDTIDEILSLTAYKALSTGLHQFEGGSSFSTYLCNIARNEAANYLKKQQNRRENAKIFYHHEISESDEDNSIQGLESASLTNNNPEHTLETKQTLDQVQSALISLEKRYPLAFKTWCLYQLEQYSVAEIHEQTGEPMVNLWRHLNKMAKCLEHLSSS